MSVYSLAYHTASPGSAHIPVHGGISVYTKVPGVYPSIAVGTLSGVVIDRSTKRKYLISNQHVFFPTGPSVKPGLQVYHAVDKIADKPIAKTYLTKGEPNPWPKEKRAEGERTVGSYHDSALAVPLINTSMEVNNIGKQGKMIEAKKGMRVKFFGKTSRLQRGVITNPSSNFVVAKGDKFSIQKDVILADITSNPGDSGSMVFTEDNRVVGLLYAETTGKREANICKATTIARAYNVAFSEAEVGGGGEGGDEPPKPKPEPKPKPTPIPFPDINIDFSDRTTQLLFIGGGVAVVLIVAGLVFSK